MFVKLVFIKLLLSPGYVWGIGGMVEDEAVTVPAGPTKCKKKKKIHNVFFFFREGSWGQQVRGPRTGRGAVVKENRNIWKGERSKEGRKMPEKLQLLKHPVRILSCSVQM